MAVIKITITIFISLTRICLQILFSYFTTENATVKSRQSIHVYANKQKWENTNERTSGLNLRHCSYAFK